MQLISLWLGFSDEDEKLLRDVVKSLGDKYDAPIFTPHLTIYGDARTEIEIMKQAALESIKDIKPFQISVDKLNYSEAFFKTVFIEFKESEFLNMISNRLQGKLSKYGNYTFKPHVSLIYKKLTDEIKKDIIKQVSIKDKFTVSKIVLVVPGNNKDDWYDVLDWRVLVTFRL